MSLTEQRVVVIGGSSGMGLATARAAADGGATVTVVSSRPERVDIAVAELPEGCDGAVVDVRDDHAVAGLFERIGELDHLVFTAGDSFTPRPLTEMSPDEARTVLDVRFWGAVQVIRSAASRIRPGGSITLTTGTVGQRPVPGAALAAAGAGAAEGLVRGLATELAPSASTWCAPAPSARRCGVPEPQRDAVFARLAQRTLLGRMGEPEEIALAHLYLMQNRYVTGTVLTVDGGLLLAG